MGCCKSDTPDPPPKTLAEIWKDFHQNTTAHGVAISANRENSRCRRLMYGSVLVSLFVSIISMMTNLIPQLSSGYAGTTILVNSSVTKLPFPAVTICNLNPYRASYLTMNRTDNITSEAITQLLDSTYGDMEYGFSMDYSFIENKYLSDVNVSQVFVEAAHRFNESYYHCAFNKMRNSCALFFDEVVTDQGICHRFNGGDDSSRFVPERGSRYGLTVYLVANTREYTYGVSQESTGFKVLIHDPKDEAVMESSGFFIMPGTQTFVAISKEEHVESRRSPCAITSSSSLLSDRGMFAYQKAETYTSSGCKQALLTACIVAKCGCKLFNFPGNHTICNQPSSINCARRAKENCLLNSTQQEAARLECPDLCHRTVYHTALSYAQFPSPPYLDLTNKAFNWSHDYTRSNLVKLNVFYDTLSVNTIRQETYELGKFISDVGGQLGFCLGASCITLMEIVEFVIDFTLKCICKSLSRLYKAVSGANKVRVF